MPKRLDVENVRNEFYKAGYTLLSNQYNNNRELLYYTCKKQPNVISRVSYSKFKSGVRCRLCKDAERRLSVEEVKSSLKTINCELLSDEYKNNLTPIKFICLSHPDVIQEGVYTNLIRRGCKLCSWEQMSKDRTGSKHHNWVGGKIPETQRLRGTERYKEWRTAVYRRDNYTCQCCGESKGNLEAHHIRNFSSVSALRFSVDNGITMCRKCHNVTEKGSYHNIYGTYNNNEEQLIKYFESKSTYFKSAFCFDITQGGITNGNRI